MNKFEMKPISEKDKDWVKDILKEHWGSEKIVTRGKIHNADTLPGFAAWRDNKPVGLVTYRIENNECEMVSLNSLVEKMGIGSCLVNAVKDVAVSFKCKRLWLITTNDNLSAIRFYQKRGFVLVAVHRKALEESRKLKPSIPLMGMDGIPLRDEIEMEMIL